MEMYFGLLGPLVVRHGEELVMVPRGKQRAMLATLLLSGNQLVLIDELARALWGEFPPPSAEITVRNYVRRLRLLLEVTGDDRITTGPGGYILRIGAGQLDVTRFERLASSVRAAVRGGRWDQVSRQARAALALWRGQPLVDVESPLLADREAPRLAEMRLQVLEASLEADVHCGGHIDVIPTLYQQVREHPLREHLHATLMLALCRCGRQGEALAAYRQARQVLVTELGVEPGPELRELQKQILTADQALTSHPTAAAVPRSVHPVPRELPAAVRQFVGRDAEIAAITEMARPAVESRPAAMPILAIAGTAGVGKTELALQWAHQVANRFPDGQLYVNLRGYDPGEPISASDALAAFLQSLGVPAKDIPTETQARAARYRSLLAGKRVLVILDNAESAEQVRPLLPGSIGSVVIVTSRDSLAGLVAREGAQRLQLEMLPLADSVNLLRALLGDRVSAIPAEATRLARHCARLPLALRVAAELAAAMPTVPVGQLVKELADHRQRLTLLDAGTDGSSAVRAVFSWSYRRLDGDVGRAFRLAALQPGPDFDCYAIAALTGTTTEQAARVLDQLVRAHLVSSTKSNRYRMHDLLRAYARELANIYDGERGIQAALTRLLLHYLRAAAVAMHALYPAPRKRRSRISACAMPAPSIISTSRARTRSDRERASLVALAVYTTERDRPAFSMCLYASYPGTYFLAAIILMPLIRIIRRSAPAAAQPHRGAAGNGH